jgi:hypothetical protein
MKQVIVIILAVLFALLGLAGFIGFVVMLAHNVGWWTVPIVLAWIGIMVLFSWVMEELQWI